MGAFKDFFQYWKNRKDIGAFFTMLNGYSPVFTSYGGGIYEMELCRACIHSFANHASKLQPAIEGADLKRVKRILETKPNEFMTTSQFLYKAATLYEINNTVFIVPILGKREEIRGYYPADAMLTELRECQGKPYLVYTFGSGEKAAIELEKTGTVSKFLYRSDLFGEDNRALNPTMQLLDTQNKGIAEGIKSSASFRFMANVGNFAKASDLAKERKRFVEENLGPDSGGLALFPNTYTNVKQILSHPQTVDAGQMKLIQDRVFTYFGTNEKILRNEASGDDWSAYYEGKIEPFALQLSQAMTSMTYSDIELTRENAIIWIANRMQYMTNADKLAVSSQLFDRGIMSTNQVMDIWNLPHVPGGEKRYIRKEYAEASEVTGTKDGKT